MHVGIKLPHRSLLRELQRDVERLQENDCAILTQRAYCTVLGYSPAGVQTRLNETLQHPVVVKNHTVHSLFVIVVKSVTKLFKAVRCRL